MVREPRIRYVVPVNEAGIPYSVQVPLATDGDSIYAKDVNTTTSTVGTFTGTITGLFDDISTELIDSTATNPKTFTVKLNRPIDTGVFRICSKTGDFSNVKIILKDASGTAVGTIDDSANNTKHKSWEYSITSVPFCQMVWEFHTADAVSVNFLAIAKNIHTHSMIMALNPSNVLGPINRTAGGNLKVSYEEIDPAAKYDYFTDVAAGNIPGKSKVNKFGNAPDFDTGDNEVTIWDGAEDGTTWEKMVYTYSTTADITHISSDNAGDTGDIEVQGLDTNGDLVTQTKALTGTTSVALDTALKRVFRAKNVGATDLVGHVFVSVGAAGGTGIPSVANIRAIIHPENNQTEMAIYTVPNGKKAYAISWYVSSAGASRSTNYLIKMRARPEGGVFQLKQKIAISDSAPYNHHYGVPNGPFSAGTDMEMTAQVTAAAITGANVIAGFDLLLIDD